MRDASQGRVLDVRAARIGGERIGDPTSISSSTLPSSYHSYVASPDGTSILCTDLRDHLLESGGGGEGGCPTPPPPSTTTLTLDPPLHFHPLHSAVSPDGRRAALAGPTTADPDVYAARVVDLSRRGGAPTSSTPSPATPTESASLAGALFAARPGLRLLQLAWHPASPRHVALLTSDATLRLYDATSAADEPEQSFELAPLRAGSRGTGPCARRGGFGLTTPQAASSPAPAPAAFAFGRGGGEEGGAGGPTSSPWERFTLYVADTGGGLWSLCPLAPFGAGVGRGEAGALAASAGEAGAPPDAREWVAAALPESLDGVPPTRIAPHALPSASPALVGPWPFASPPPPGAALAPAPPCARGLLSPASRSDTLACLAWMGLPPSPAVALVAASKGGWLGVAALAGPAGPAWTPTAPRVALHADDEDDVEDSNAYDDALEPRPAIAAVESVARGVGPGTRTALLLDAVDLVSGGGAFEEDGGDGTASDDDDDATRPSPPLLLPDPADPARLYAVVAAGAAGPAAAAVDLAWLPGLSARLSAAAAAAPAPLPPVYVTPLATGDAGWASPGARLVGGAAVGAPATGGGLVVVVVAPGGGGGAPPVARLLCVPRGSGAGASTTTAPPLRAIEPGGSPSEDLKAVAGGPPALPPPPSTANDDPATPAGAAALASRAAALTDGPVAFIQHAATVLAGRTEAVGGASGEASARAQAVEGEATALTAASAAAAPRLASAAALQANLEARARLLARLHWGRPAPLTPGEAAFRDGELPLLEGSAAALAAEVGGLALRAGAARAAADGEEGEEDGYVHVAAAAPPPPLPPGELRAAKAAVADQAGLVGAAVAGLNAVEAAVVEAEDAVRRAEG